MVLCHWNNLASIWLHLSHESNDSDAVHFRCTPAYYSHHCCCFWCCHHVSFLAQQCYHLIRRSIYTRYQFHIFFDVSIPLHVIQNIAIDSLKEKNRREEEKKNEKKTSNVRIKQMIIMTVNKPFLRTDFSYYLFFYVHIQCRNRNMCTRHEF